MLIVVASLVIGAYIALLRPGASGRGWWTALWAVLFGGIVIALWWLSSRWILAREGFPVARARFVILVSWLGAASILATFLPIYLLYPDYPHLTATGRIYILLVAAAAVPLVQWVGLLPRISRPRGAGWRAEWLLALLILSYLGITVWLANYRWQILTLGNNDSAIVVQSLFYTVEGDRLFFNTLEKASHLAVHSSLIYYLLLPLYALLRTPRAILTLLPPLVIALSAWPFFQIARPRLRSGAALALTAAYLACPYVLARATGDLYEMTLLPLVLLPGLYYYEQERFVPFIFFLLLSLSVKESIAATVIFIGLHALLQRRARRWVIAPLLLGAASLWLSFGVIMPHFAEGAITSRAAALLGPLGGTPQEALANLWREPLSFLRHILSMARLGFIYQLFQPFLLALPWLSGEIVLALPALALNLLAQGGSIGICAWESVIFGPLLFVAATSALRRLSTWLARRTPLEARAWHAIGALLILLATLACLPYCLRAEDYRARPHLAAQRAALALIPSAASVSAPDYMLAHLARRPFLQLQTGAPFWAEYQIVDIHWIAEVRGRRLAESAAQEYITLVAKAEQGRPYAGLQLLWSQDGVYVFKRTEG